MFKGYDDYNEVLRLIFDLETEGLDPTIKRIIEVGVRFNRPVKTKTGLREYEQIFKLKGTTEEEKNAFAGLENFGADIREMKSLLAKTPGDRMKEEFHKGIPYKDSLNNQLSSWVRNARESSWQRKESFLKVAIKGDANEQYGTIKEIMNILQKQRQNRFYLVTGLRTDDF